MAGDAPAALFPAKGPTTESLAAADPTAAPPKPAGASGDDDARAQVGALRATLAEVTARLDRIEHDEKLARSGGQNSSSGLADVTARLDALEKKVAPDAPAENLTDVEAELARLEKNSAGAGAPSTALADLSTRLDKLEKRTAAQTANATGAASAAKPAPVPPKRPTVEAREAPPPSAAGAARRLPDYAVEGVENGFAVIGSRYGEQQVAPGDFIPGAGRVLRIERRGGDWVVVTSNGVIAGAPPY